jgi:Protein of unknown function (DUF1579)
MNPILAIFTITALFFATTNASAETSAPMDAKKQEMMKKYQAAATPGEPHKMLAGIAGQWRTESKMWETANAKPETSKGVANFKMILGGRWLQQDFQGTAMGQSFEGLGLLGYDNIKKKYVSQWYDSMSTGTMKAEGDYDTKSKTLKDKGSMSCPMSASGTQDVRTEWQMTSKNKMVFSMFGSRPEGGPEFKMMEVVYSR